MFILKRIHLQMNEVMFHSIWSWTHRRI